MLLRAMWAPRQGDTRRNHRLERATHVQNGPVYTTTGPGRNPLDAGMVTKASEMSNYLMCLQIDIRRGLAWTSIISAFCFLQPNSHPYGTVLVQKF